MLPLLAVLIQACRVASEVAVQVWPPAPPVGKPSACTAPQPTNPSPTGGGTKLLFDELLLELITLELIVLERTDELDEGKELAMLVDLLLERDDLLLERDDVLIELAILDLLDVAVPEGIEHSLVPPATLVPAPKVISPQTKLPLRVL